MFRTCFYFMSSCCCLPKRVGGEGQPLPAPPQAVKWEHLKLCFTWTAAVLLYGSYLLRLKEMKEKKSSLPRLWGVLRLPQVEVTVSVTSDLPTLAQAPFQLLGIAGDKKLQLLRSLSHRWSL